MGYPTTHGKSRTIEYRTWASMISRCSNEKTKSYSKYGAKGISVCERWKSFEAFYEDVGPRPSDHHSIDRYPNQNGNYEPGNVRWATLEEQNANRCTASLLTFNGETLCVAEWSRRTGLSESLIRHRIRRGWSDGDTLTRPSNRKKQGT